ncbi:MAG: hypothetical protein V1800_15385 [Candidatus Latescibacterota bacterium]
MMHGRGQYLVVGIVLFLMGMAGCAEKPTETPLPASNPESSITGVAITGSMTRIYANGVDTDGLIEGYKFRFDGGAWTEWQAGSVLDQTIVYASLDEEHTIEVVVKDDTGLEDPTPAKLAYTPRNIGTLNRTPDTAIKNPPSGASVSAGVVISWEGNDPDGTVVGYVYKMDWDPWAAVGSHVTSRTFTGLAVGAHTFSVKAKDNLGVMDSTPASLSFFVEGGFAPELEVTEGPANGATFFVSAGATSDFTLKWNANVDFYFGDIEGYSYTFDGVTADFSLGLTEATLENLGPGNYTVDIEAKDKAGSVAKETISFDIVVPPFTESVLTVNGVDWASYGEAPSMYAGLPLDSSTGWAFWDWFPSGPAGGYPAGYAPVGHGNLNGAELGKYRVLVWVAAFNEDFASNLALIKSYIQAGGKLLMIGHNLPSYLGADFAKNYAHITWGTADVAVTASNPMVALEGGLVDVGPGNGAASASLSDLMALDDSGLSEGILAYGTAGGELIGIKSRLSAGGDYQVVLIGTRPFRVDPATLSPNIGYIIETIFGE